MTVNKLLLISLFILVSFFCNSQKLLSQNKNFTRQDSLRGNITPEREWWDLTYYHLDIKVEPDKKFISGKNTIVYKVLKEDSIIQIDLQAPMHILKVIQNGQQLYVNHKGNAHYIHLKKRQVLNTLETITVYYEGFPKEAVRAPWDGGISWKRDKNNNHFIASSCQGIGASVWWPCKDHMYDEVDSMDISVNVPDKLINVSNGRLKLVQRFDDTKTYHWTVKNPISNYAVNINIGDYTNFYEVYNGMAGPLDIDYYVLKHNVHKAKKHFKQVPKMMAAFEYWFGQYPFYADSFKLVEVPYLGMEHQSSVTYGNNFENGYLGQDLSKTGWGLKFDFILVHESGHEWFANSITNKDVADMWIHESFTSYSENLYLDYYFGKEASAAYVIGTRALIENKVPIIGTYNVNAASEGTDMYYKGSNMLHTLRQIVNNDKKWRNVLKGLNRTFYHKTVTTKEIENYLSDNLGIDLTLFFNQYLRTTKIPTLEYRVHKKNLNYRYTNIIKNFNMPLQVFINEQEITLLPSAKWKLLKINSKITSFKIDKNYYILSNNTKK